MEWLTGDAATKKARALEDAKFAEQFYNLNVAQANASANGGGDYGMAAAQANAELQKQVAARQNSQQAEYIREALASRGLSDSGQTPFEQANRQFGYDTELKGIQNDLDARASAAAQARADSQSRLASQLQEMQLRYQQDQLGNSRYLSDIDTDLARNSGGVLMSMWDRLQGTGAFNTPTMMASWDPTSGMYRSSDGRYWNADGTPGSYSAPSSGPTPGVDLGGYVPNSNVVTEFPASRPATNPVPGAPWQAV
jgi:hypothetical protein